MPVAGPKVAASTATPAVTEAGANGTIRPLPWANITSSTAAGVAGSAKAARKQPSEATRQARLAHCHGSTPRAYARGEPSAAQPAASRRSTPTLRPSR